MKKDHSYVVYILTNKHHSVLYTGVTNNIERRLHEHKNKSPKGFTAKYNVDMLVYYSWSNDINGAIEEEKRIKAGSRQQKIRLIEEMNPLWEDLSGLVLEGDAAQCGYSIAGGIAASHDDAGELRGRRAIDLAHAPRNDSLGEALRLSNSRPRFLLHSGKDGQFSFLGLGKKHEVSLDGNDPDILDHLYKFWEKYGQEKQVDHPGSLFEGGVFVFLSYDLIENFEGIPLKNPNLIPKIYACVPEELFVFDTTVETSAAADVSTMPQHEWHSSISQAEYEKNIEMIKQEITKGNSFQVNYSQRFLAEQRADSWDIFQSLCTVNPSPFSAFFETPFGDIISGSPERLVSLKNGILETKPIAGTRKRSSGAHDEELKQELNTNTKEQAEHAMIVDLERNDMGRVCEFGSVKVQNYAQIERYSHVQHLVSIITGKLQPNKNFCDVIRAMHPGGTITGCPKVETCKIIHEHELFDRSIYTGSLGYINHKGDMDLNILIRTIFAHNGKLETQAGGGIVFDSNPQREYEETLHKARAQFMATNGELEE